MRNDRDDDNWDAQRCCRELLRSLLKPRGVAGPPRLFGGPVSFENAPGGSGNHDEVARIMDQMNRLDCWKAVVEQVVRLPSDRVLGEKLLSLWSCYGLRRIPMGLKNDVHLFADALVRHLEPYVGPGLTLYRGELQERYKAGVIGIAWTSSIEVAEMFASRRVTLGEGPGVLLRAEVETSAIIVGPTAHSNWLQEYEYIVRPSALRSEVVATFPDIRDQPG